MRNKISEPKKRYEVTTDDTDANNSGTKEAKAKSRLNISTAKMMAAIGALNIEAMAPAVAHPISNILFFGFR